MKKEQKTKEKLEKLEQVEFIINCALERNFCKDNPKKLLDYIDHDLEGLQELKEKSTTNEQECLADHCMEHLCLLQLIIEIVKGVE